MTKKIINFKQDIDSLLKRANARYEKGDFPIALSYQFKAWRLMPDDADIVLEIAFLYGEMGLFNSQLKYLIRLLSMGKEDSEVYKEIIKCYFEMGLYEQSLYYYKEGLDLCIFDDDTVDEILEFDYESDYSDIKMRDKRDNANIMQLSHKLMLSGDLDFAKQLMETISPDSHQYIEATNNLAVIALTTDNAQQAIKYSQKTLDADDENVFALSHCIIAYSILGDDAKKQEYINRLLDLDIKIVSEISVAAFAMQRIFNDELALFFLEKLLRFLPYSHDHLIAAAIANSNCGHHQRARELLVRANNIFPEDTVIIYYSKLLIGATQKTSLEILSTLPPDTTAQWIADLDEFILKRNSKIEIDIDDTIQNKIFWAFQYGDLRIQTKLANVIVREPKWEAYIRELLIDPSFDYRVKKECLLALMLNCKNKKFDLFITDVFLNFSPKIPSGHYSDEFVRAYWQVYTTLAFIAGDFDKKLNKCFRSIANYYSQEHLSKLKINAMPLSALILYRLNMKHIFKTKTDCCEIFGCDLTDFDTYDEIFPRETFERKKIDGSRLR